MLRRFFKRFVIARQLRAYHEIAAIIQRAEYRGETVEHVREEILEKMRQFE
jgi:hypothetical protein